MGRTVFRQTLRRAAFALTAVTLWDRFLNRGTLGVVRDGFLVAGVFLLVLAWFSYLKLDGVRIRPLPGQRGKERPGPRAAGDLADSADGHPVPREELEPDEQTLCALLSSLTAGSLFLIPALTALLV